MFYHIQSFLFLLIPNFWRMSNMDMWWRNKFHLLSSLDHLRSQRFPQRACIDTHPDLLLIERLNCISRIRLDCSFSFQMEYRCIQLLRFYCLIQSQLPLLFSYSLFLKMLHERFSWSTNPNLALEFHYLQNSCIQLTSQMLQCFHNCLQGWNDVNMNDATFKVNIKSYDRFERKFLDLEYHI